MSKTVRNNFFLGQNIFPTLRNIARGRFYIDSKQQISVVKSEDNIDLKDFLVQIGHQTICLNKNFYSKFFNFNIKNNSDSYDNVSDGYDSDDNNSDEYDENVNILNILQDENIVYDGVLTIFKNDTLLNTFASAYEEYINTHDYNHIKNNKVYLHIINDMCVLLNHSIYSGPRVLSREANELIPIEINQILSDIAILLVATTEIFEFWKDSTFNQFTQIPMQEHSFSIKSVDLENPEHSINQKIYTKPLVIFNKLYNLAMNLHPVKTLEISPNRRCTNEVLKHLVTFCEIDFNDLLVDSNGMIVKKNSNANGELKKLVEFLKDCESEIIKNKIIDQIFLTFYAKSKVDINPMHTLVMCTFEQVYKDDQ